MSTDLEQNKQELETEIEKLKHEYKIELPKKIAEARAYGDLKENAEYHAARERQSFVKARIAQMQMQLANLQDIDISTLPEDKVDFGSTVVLVAIESDDRLEFTFVSSNDVDPSEGKISLSSPYGNALQGKSVGESVEVAVPAGKKSLYIEKLITIHGKIHEDKYQG